MWHGYFCVITMLPLACQVFILESHDLYEGKGIELRFHELCRNSGNEHQNNPLAGALLVRQFDSLLVSVLSINMINLFTICDTVTLVWLVGFLWQVKYLSWSRMICLQKNNDCGRDLLAKSEYSQILIPIGHIISPISSWNHPMLYLLSRLSDIWWLEMDVLIFTV